MMYLGRVMTSELFQSYFDGLQLEEKFWKDWFLNKGGEWPQDYEDRTSVSKKPPEVLISQVHDCIKKNDLQSINVCDVGSGPISVASNILEFTSVPGTFLAFDPLARAYSRMLQEHSLDQIQKPIFSLAENFPRQTLFDVIYSRNAIDHSFDAPRSVLSLASALKIGGRLVLNHFENEASYEKYDGIHHWNFESVENSFHIWSRSERLNISSLLGESFNTIIETTPGPERNWTTVIIEKLAGWTCPTWNSDEGLSDFERALSE